jgi:hypothetical protein
MPCPPPGRVAHQAHGSDPQQHQAARLGHRYQEAVFAAAIEVGPDDLAGAVDAIEAGPRRPPNGSAL